MTHDTPHDTDARRRWCEHCRLAVEPVGEDGAECPSCGEVLDAHP